MSGFIYACRRSILLSIPSFFLEKLPLTVIAWFDRIASTLFILTEFTTDAPSKRKYSLKKEKDRSPVHERYKKFRTLLKVLKKGWVQAFLIWMIYLTLCWNLTNINVPNWEPPSNSRWLMWITRNDQMWNMFSPNPPHGSFWYVMPGETLGGEQIEIFDNGGLFTWEPNRGPIDWNAFPANFLTNFKSHRWFKIWENGFNQPSNDWLRLSMGRYICREYNSHHKGPDALAAYQIWITHSLVNEDGTKKVSGRSLLWSHQCFDKVPAMKDLQIPPLP